MKREIYNALKAWKSSEDRKPLILDGARQVGKTWIIKEFGEREYQQVAYLNCDRLAEMKTLFYDFDVKRLLRAFSSIVDMPILPGETLIILDEIQEAPGGITALKYFCEEAPDYHIICAGSLLGINLHSGTGYPVGKVDELRMFPMTFEEFLDATGNSLLLEEMKRRHWEALSPMAVKLVDLLRQYYYVGGMPEAVDCYVRTQNLHKVREIQNRILKDYRLDFARHVPTDQLPRVIAVWDSLPSQLARENKKFIYGVIKKGARAREYENAIQWLLHAGLVHKISRVNSIQRPLKFYEDVSAFKLFILDLGLLGALVDVSAREMLTEENFFVEYKGAFTEQFIAQEMLASNYKLYYYSKENSPLEIDFIIQKEFIYPIEVKAEENLKSKSLRSVYSENTSLKPVRFSMAGYKEQDWVINVPLYLARVWMEGAD
ncbi:MAG: ATP-binding protein [Lachnospiraceae bacterium]|nr:ATP-binding protein [Lachnospiraceae bacterium]